MTVRKPIVLVGNNAADLPAGDEVYGDLSYLVAQALTAAQQAQALANLGFGGSFASSGVLEIPSNLSGKKLYVQWGSATPPSASSVNVPFPIAFPNGCYAVALTAQAQSGTLFAGQVYGATASSFNATMFAVGGGAPSLSAIGFYWIAIGF